MKIWSWLERITNSSEQIYKTHHDLGWRKENQGHWDQRITNNHSVDEQEVKDEDAFSATNI